jgi:hypothetical protein
VFTVVSVVVAALFAINFLNLLAPWTGVNLDNSTDPDSHRWHHALEGALDVLVVVIIVALLLRPLARSLLAQFLAVAILLSAAMELPFVGPGYLVIAAAVIIVPALYPWPAALRRFRSVDGVSVPMLVVATGAAALLLPRAVQELTWQVTGYLGEHATSTAWVTDATRLVLLATAGLVAASRLPGWRVLAFGCVAVYAYLGLVAILQPAQPGSWGVAGGIAAWVCAVGFLAAIIADRKQRDLRAGRADRVAALRG